jgi:hypothetical protein
MTRLRFPVLAAAAFAASAVVFAASFGPWRVYAGDSFAMSLEPAWTIYVGGGRVVASRTHVVSSYISFPPPPSWRNWGGFSYEKRRFAGIGGAVSGKVMSEHLAIPTWPLPLAGGLLLAWRLRRWRVAAAPGRCPQCGYDLRATPQEGKALLDRCPECGATPPTPATGTSTRS